MNKQFLGVVKWLSGGMLSKSHFIAEANIILEGYSGDTLKLINVYGTMYNGLVFATEEVSQEAAQRYFNDHLNELGLSN